MIAFKTLADACSFCVALQHALMKVKWPAELYASPLAAIEEDDHGLIVWKVRCRPLLSGIGFVRAL